MTLPRKIPLQVPVVPMRQWPTFYFAWETKQIMVGVIERYWMN